METMNKFLFAGVCISAALMSGCQAPVSVKKNFDGSETVSIQGEDFSVNANDKTGESTFKDDKGNVVKSKTNEDGTYSMESTNAKGEKFTMDSGKEVDLTQFGLKPYPGAVADDKNNSQSMIETNEGKNAFITVFTQDSKEKVAEFYAPQITKDKNELKTDEAIVLSGKTSNNSEVFVSASKVDGRTQISITAGIKKR